MIDVYSAGGVLPDPHKLAMNAAPIVEAVEQVPDRPMFRGNSAAFVHELPPNSE